MNYRDIRKITWIYCVNDNELLLIATGEYGLYCKCPRYYLRNRELGEPACKNQLSIYDANAIYKRLAEIYNDDVLDEAVSFVINDISVTIRYVSDKRIEIEVLNTKPKKKKRKYKYIDKPYL